ncbi:MAG: hypothetical protein NTX57_06750 [Armatimonadetes bacterium]|nr:hypothetical protein [Armatimonadota bacterium]
MDSPTLRETDQAMIQGFDKMQGEIILFGVKKLLIGGDAPPVAFEGVTGRATVHQILCAMCSTVDAGLEVVAGEPRSHIVFVDTTVTTTKLIALAE